VSADIVVPDRGGTADSAAELPRASISLEGARSRARADFPGLDARVDLRRAASEIQVSGSIAPRLGGSLDVNGTIGDMQPSAFPFAGFGPKNPLHLLLVGSLGEDAVAELATFADLRFSGLLNARMEIGGTIERPVLEGSVRLENGHYVAALSGCELTDIRAELRAAGRAAPKIDATASDGFGGTVRASGALDFSRGVAAPELALAVDLEKVRVAQLDDVKVTVDGRLELQIDPDDVALVGNLTTTDVELAISESRPPDIVVLEVKEENVEVLGLRREVPPPVSPGPPVEFDIGVMVPGPAFLRGRDFTTEWRGKVHVTGSSSAPAFEGKLDLIRGEFKALGVRLRATKGSIVFDPAPWASPLVDLRGVVRKSSVTVTVIVTGPLDELSIDLESDPPMPEDEILSFLLFGTGVANLTPVQALQLGAAVAALANPGGGMDPMRWVRNTTGLDRVDVVGAEDETNEYAISAGKYVRDGVYVSVEQPLGKGASQVAAELEVTKNITLRTTVGADASGTLGATWSFDY
jgi:translocation and assembly module TamB